VSEQCRLQVCQQEGIPVDLMAPAVDSADTWDGMFITSTSRLVLPVDKVELPDGRVLHFSSSPLVLHLQQKVADAIRDRSETCL
jgi:branched-subunit amino acid aminotransferase/4-amino-4-deoxychorismate lyase